MWECCRMTPAPEDADGVVGLPVLTVDDPIHGPAVPSVNRKPLKLPIADRSPGIDSSASSCCSCHSVLHSSRGIVDSHQDMDSNGERDKQVQPQGLNDISSEFPWTELELCTCNFASQRLLGSGHAGNIYHGMLDDGTQVAIKVMKHVIMNGFEKEIRLLSKCHHPNVVMLLGFATLAPTRNDEDGTIVRASKVALVYELLPGGTASERLRLCHSRDKPYLWKERLKHAVETARGLSHLHRQKPTIFHRDIKTSNILFARDGEAKIADFGLACASTNGDGAYSTASWANSTQGYRDPLFETTSIMTEENEVYSMGMILIEFLTGRPPCTRNPKLHFLLDELMLQYDNSDDVRLAANADMHAQWAGRTAKDLGALAVSCIQPDTRKRPAFRDLAVLLQAMSTSGGHFKPILNGKFAHRGATPTEKIMSSRSRTLSEPRSPMPSRSRTSLEPRSPTEAKNEFPIEPTNRFLQMENNLILKA